MALTPEQMQRLREAAITKGVSPESVVAAGERFASSSASATESGDDEPDTGEESALTAERFLVGFLPYITVREFRTIVLGIDTNVADEQLFTGEWLVLHGGAHVTGGGEEPEGA